MATNAEIEYAEIETKLAALGIDAWDVCKAAGVNMSGRWERRALPVLREALAKATPIVRTRRIGCNHGESDNRGICYTCGAYNREHDAMA